MQRQSLIPKIDNLCAERGVTYADISRATGIAQSTMSNWRKRNGNITSESLSKIADYFDVSINYFLDGKGSEIVSNSGTKYYFDDHTAEVAQDMFNNQDLRVLFDAERTLSQESIKSLYNMVLHLKKLENGDAD